MFPPKKLGRFTLERKIAVGGMAEIWLASQKGPAGFSKQAVIKRILPHLAKDKKFIEMFQDEARVAALLEHPNIVRIWELDEDDGVPFIAMEYIDGPDLEYLINRAIQLNILIPQPIAARIVADALMGLHSAHTLTDDKGESLSIVHRDVSPHNILVGRAGAIKVCDFGVAKAVTSRHKTETGAVKGKFGYMSPEQIADKPLDGRSDIFSMGIVLYELTTNQRPFGDVAELLAVTAILTQKPADPREFVEDFPNDLEKIIMRALSKNRDERYGSAQAMAQDLERFLQSRQLLVTHSEVSRFVNDLLSDTPSFLDGEDAPPLHPRYEEDGRVPGPSAEHGPEPPRKVEIPDPEPTPAPKPAVKAKPVEPPKVSLDDPSKGGASMAAPIGGFLALVVLGIGALLIAGAGLAYMYWPVEVSTKDPVVKVPKDKDPKTAKGKDPKTVKGKDPKATKDKDPKVDAKNGVLVINSKPKADVFLGEELLGRTPDNFKLPVGRHKVQLVNTQMGLSKVIKVNIAKPPEITTIYKVFEVGTLTLNFITDNPYRLTIDGADYEGDIRAPIELISGEHTITIHNTTGQNQAGSIKIAPGAPVVFNVRI